MIFSTSFVKTLVVLKEFSDIGWEIYIDLHVKYKNFGQSLMELEYCRQIFEKYSNIKFRENRFSRNGVLCERTDRFDSNSRFPSFCECIQMDKMKEI